MEPWVALDQTIKFFKLKAVDLAAASGIDRHEISKYRRGHKDMGSHNLQKLITALPLKARLYYCYLCFFGETLEIQDEFHNGKQGKKAAIADSSHFLHEHFTADGIK